MSTEFNPATFEHKGVIYEADMDESRGGCRGCHFDDTPDFCQIPMHGPGACAGPYRPDGNSIIWVLPQEGKKA